jgi:hypothetical protein
MGSADKPRLCPNCGTEVAAVDMICWRCYRRLPPPAPPQPKPVRRRRSRVSASAIMAAVVILGLSGYLWYVRTSPTAALTAFLRAQASGDVKAMYELMSIRSRVMMGPEVLAQEGTAAVSPSAYVVRSVKREGDTAKVVLSVTPLDPSASATAVEWPVYMIWEAGRWRVDVVRTTEGEIPPDAALSGREVLRRWRAFSGAR